MWYDLPIKLPPKIPSGYKHAYHLYTVIIDKKVEQTKREKILLIFYKEMELVLEFIIIQFKVLNIIKTKLSSIIQN